MSEIESRIRKLISDVIQVRASDIEAESRLIEDLGADSLALVELSVACHETFQVTIDDDELGTLITVRDLVETVERLEQSG